MPPAGRGAGGDGPPGVLDLQGGHGGELQAVPPDRVRPVPPQPARRPGVGGLRPALAGEGPPRRRLARALGLAVGWGAVAVGVAGLLYHLDSAFFDELTLKNLVYTSPFAAPLANTGV